jgi:hypothetical protein
LEGDQESLLAFLPRELLGEENMEVEEVDMTGLLLLQLPRLWSEPKDQK